MAAFEDPRFLELSFEEFKKIEIEISILTPPIIVEYKDFEDLKSKIRPYIDGVIIEQDGKEVLFCHKFGICYQILMIFLLIYAIKVDLK